MFNHRPCLKGKVTHFVKEFEKKRGDQEVQNLFETLEVTTELQSGQVEKLVNTCDEQIPTINANLLVAQSMCNKILDQAKNSELVSSPKIKQEIFFLLIQQTAKTALVLEVL